MLKDVENLLGLELWDYSDCMVPYTQYSDVSKMSIQKCYDILKDYLHSDDVENEECYVEMRMEIDKLKISIPNDIFQKIVEFIDKEIDPIIYESDKVFASLYTEEYGFMDGAGVFHIKGEEEFKQILGKHIEIMIGIENKLDEFAVSELAPILSK